MHSTVRNGELLRLNSIYWDLFHLVLALWTFPKPELFTQKKEEKSQLAYELHDLCFRSDAEVGPSRVR